MILTLPLSYIFHASRNGLLLSVGSGPERRLGASNYAYFYLTTPLFSEGVPPRLLALCQYLRRSIVLPPRTGAWQKLISGTIHDAAAGFKPGVRAPGYRMSVLEYIGQHARDKERLPKEDCIWKISRQKTTYVYGSI